MANDSRNPSSSEPSASDSSRRDFLKTSAVLAGGAGGLFAPAVHAAGGDMLRVGLVGCGGRGTGAAAQAMAGDPNVQLVAMGDMFADKLAASKENLKPIGDKLGGNFAVTDETSFTGFDAYKKVVDMVDVVLLASPPGFRPAHIKYAVDAGKHIFAEKPCAVDGPGVRAVLAAAEEAKKKNLAMVSGFCWRYHEGMRSVIGKILDGSKGKILALEAIYNTRRPHGFTPREAKMTEMEYQLRHWYFYTWLSGDHNVEQHIHSLDKMAWVMGNTYPVKAFGVGGRSAIAEGEPGNIFDNHAVTYEFADGVRCHSLCRQQLNTSTEVEDYVTTDKGRTALVAAANNEAIAVKRKTKKGVDMYQTEHDELFASIRAGKPINDGESMAKSSLVGIMGRMATYTGQTVTWEQAMNSTEDLTPPVLEFGSTPIPPIAIPGVTKLI
ncbi:MAG: Gfo/Idh/MocA family protein [Planctomycetia bacterium]